MGAVRIVDAGARAIKFQAVIGALNPLALHDLSHMQWSKAMRTTVRQRRHTQVRLAIEDDRLVHDFARE